MYFETDFVNTYVLANQNYWQAKNGNFPKSNLKLNFTNMTNTGVPAFRDFTIRDSVLGLNFVNSPPFHDFEKKIIKYFRKKFRSDCHLMKMIFQ